jgi:Flp pilus assembly protein TadD
MEDNQGKLAKADIPALMREAFTHQQAGRLGEAEQLCNRVLSIDPDHAEAYNLLGIIASSIGRKDIAIELIGRAIRLSPENSHFYNNLGILFREQNKLKEADLVYERAIRLAPDSPDIYSNWGETLAEMDRLEEAVGHYKSALALKPDSPEAFNNLGVAYRSLNRMADALSTFEHAKQHAPDHADIRWNLAYSLLLSGRFAEGWVEHEWRWKTPAAQPHGLSLPLWDGSDFRGQNLLLHAEQGFGDSIQFIRYAPMVKARGGTVLLTCPPELYRLFRHAPGIDRVLQQGDDIPPCAWRAPLMSLPMIFGTELATVPAKTPYLKPEPASVREWGKRFADKDTFKVGIAWRGRPTHKNDRHRSIPIGQFAPMLAGPGITVVCLQKDATDEEMAELGRHSEHVLNLGKDFTDLADTAAAMESLDLVITVDTALCHLAGALARPAWTLLPFAPDWRWLMDRTDSPWYPTMRLYRQAKRGAWGTTLDRVKKDLSALLTKPP